MLSYGPVTLFIMVVFVGICFLLDDLPKETLVSWYYTLKNESCQISSPSPACPLHASYRCVYTQLVKLDHQGYYNISKKVVQCKMLSGLSIADDILRKCESQLRSPTNWKKPHPKAHKHIQRELMTPVRKGLNWI